MGPYPSCRSLSVNIILCAQTWIFSSIWFGWPFLCTFPLDEPGILWFCLFLDTVMTRSWRHSRETAWGPFPTSHGWEFRVQSLDLLESWSDIIQFPSHWFFYSTGFAKSIFPSTCSIMDYRLYITGRAPHRAVVRITMKSCIQSTQCRAQHSGSHSCVHFETSGKLWERLRLCFTTRDLVLIGLGCGLDFGCFKNL